MSKPPILEVDSVAKRFGSKTVLEDVSFALVSGETLTIMAPSGAGKSTLLRVIAGLEQPDRGGVRISGRDVTDLPPEQRRLGFVFQHYALFPHLTVFENLAFPLRLQHLSSDEIRQRVDEALQSINLQHAAGRMPQTLSGGEQQRVAIMRAVISRPALLLLDEPFAALDQYLREQLQLELWKLRDELQIAVLLVSHDAPFGLAISDRIMVLQHGRIAQIGPPREVFERPANRFVAQILGPVNSLDGRLLRVHEEDGRCYGVVRLAHGGVAGGVLRAPPAAESVTLMVRPNSVEMARSGPPGALSGSVRAIQYRGSYVTIVVETPDGATIAVERNHDGLDGLAHADAVSLWWKHDDATIV